MVNFKRVAFVCGENAANALEHDVWMRFNERAEGKDPVSKAFQALLKEAEKGAFGESNINWRAVVNHCREMAKDKPVTVGQWYELMADKIDSISPVGRCFRELIKQAAAGEFKGEGEIRL